MKWLNCEKIRLPFGSELRVELMLVVFIVSGFLSMASVCSAAEYVWTQKADMPTPRWCHSSVTVDGKIYVIGGVSSEPDSEVLSTIEEYDPTTDTWIRKADMPTPRGWIPPSSPVVDGKIYVIGGGDDIIWDLPTVEEYDPATDTWTRKADMPTPRWSLATCAVDGKIYAIGGAPNSYTGLRVVEQYDPETDTWTRKADMPTGVWGLCANIVNGKIYVLGGRPGYTAIPNVQEYDPATDTWTRKADMPVGTSQMASVVLGDKIVVIGGWIHSNNPPYTTVQIYDPETDMWRMDAKAPFLRACFSADVVNNRIYVIGGTDKIHPCPATSTVYEFGPLIDFNDDGIVDIDDLVILIESWGTDDPLCDIAPLPFSDGVVDILDLELFMSFWGQEVDDPTLKAHWKLDETEGNVAHDSKGEYDGMLNGNPLWQPEGGIVDGALEFDGVDDYIRTPSFVLTTLYDEFSVFAWIKGGAPGQVVISQIGRTRDWLYADPANGCLMTELRHHANNDPPLLSEAIITDGEWHRVGLVWDLSYRILYVDDVEVASDEQESVGALYGGLNIGAGKSRAAGSYWSGLIDDVRIYNRAVTP